ncbi:Anti-sigma regulatory factor (Ser/Thr protein kinase) [Streptomyces sp. yr375]|uniref:ATP-binding protein n=1 Tax=Streptomyces sp. yr375 TaxID=1761906 RepID=UPI0008B4C4C8|nr:ATP-binding protein [Streptomyces sp. yr375]SES46159.1 Anti-sigma regulatory factor (Ser/Thr protein kinase) [Streptomyces sp. yr375]
MIEQTASPELQPAHHFRNFCVRLSPTPRGARLARLLAVEQLRSWELPLDPARQLVAELATNAATHGRIPGRDFRLSLYVIANTLRIEVTDTMGDRPPRPRRTPPETDSESGRGLLIVEALADRWGWAPEMRPRKTVWAEVALPRPRPLPRPLAPEPDASCSGARGALSQGPRG